MVPQVRRPVLDQERAGDPRFGKGRCQESLRRRPRGIQKDPRRERPRLNLKARPRNRNVQPAANASLPLPPGEGRGEGSPASHQSSCKRSILVFFRPDKYSHLPRLDFTLPSPPLLTLWPSVKYPFISPLHFLSS